MLTIERPPLPTPVDDGTRREFIAGGLTLAALLAGCGSDTEEASSDRRVIKAPEGTVTLEHAPERIGVMSGSRVFPFLLPFLESAEFDIVGYHGDNSAQTHPWIPAKLWRLPRDPDNDGYDIERLATWNADLFIGNGNIGNAFDPIEKKLAPVLRLPETDWRLTTRLLGETFQAAGVAERVIADTEAVIADARRSTPVSAAIVSPYQENGTLGFQTLGAELPNFLGDLNIKVAPSPKKTQFQGYEDVSLERISERLDDVDWVLVFYNSDELTAGLLENPLFRRTGVVQRGNVIVLDAEQSSAGFPATPPSIPVIIEAVREILRS